MKLLDVIGPVVDDGGKDIMLIIIGVVAFLVAIIAIYVLWKKTKEVKVMKKINLFLLGILVLGITCVKADAGPPSIAEYEIVISNKNGAVCYKYDYSTNEKYKPTNYKIEYGKKFEIYSEIKENYVFIYNEEVEECYVKLSDIKTTDDTYNLNNSSVEKLTPVKAVILAKGGLNMRKGPSVAFKTITTIPQYSVVTLKYNGGTYWYYAEYNGKSGWISGINQYFGYDNEELLYSYKETEIYDVKDKEKVIGKIPPLTEITDYLRVINYNADGDGSEYNFWSYVNYNGIKGFIYWMPVKVDGSITLLKDSKLYDLNRKYIKTIKKGTTLNCSIIDDDDIEEIVIYVPSEKGIIIYEGYEYFKENGETKYLKKTSGYIGEGLFGEKKMTNNNEPIEKPEEKKETDNPVISSEEKAVNTELILICVLGSIVLALTIIIIILLVNKKKSAKSLKKEPIVNNNQEEKKIEENRGENDVKEKDINS